MARHYIVASGYTLTAGELNDYVQLMPGASINLTGGNVTKNIWGPGNMTMSGNVNMSADIGVEPAAHLLNSCQKVHITSNTSI